MYILWQTKTRRFKRYVITDETKHKPCACAWEEKSRHERITEAIDEKTRLEKEDFFTGK